MNTAAAENQSLVQEAVAALQAGNSKKAREVFERVVAAGETDTSSWLGLAFACAQLGDDKATIDAVNKALELEPRFGYDALFVPEGESRTFAELTPAEKNALSHRGQALRKFAAYLRE